MTHEKHPFKKKGFIFDQDYIEAGIFNEDAVFSFDLSPQEIANQVLEYAIRIAEWRAGWMSGFQTDWSIKDSRKSKLETLENLPRTFTYFWKIRNLRPVFRERCHELVESMRELREHLLTLKTIKKKAKKVRSNVSSQYEKLFVKIGRRDGFSCSCCDTSKDLQIDHIRPVSKGGGNEPENLQLLCGACNKSKSDKYQEVAQ